LAQVGALDLNPTAAGKDNFASLPNGSGAGIWGAGGAVASDGSHIYASVGNGPFDGTKTFGDSILKLSQNNVQVLDFFTPFDQAIDQEIDQDLGLDGLGYR
jgi:hypothetical protein